MGERSGDRGATEDVRVRLSPLYDDSSSVSNTDEVAEGEGGGNSSPAVVLGGGGPMSVRSFVGDDGPRAEGCILFAGRGGSLGVKSSDCDKALVLFRGGGMLTIFVVLDPYAYTGVGSPGGGAGRGCALIGSSENRAGALLIRSSISESFHC